MTAAQTDIVVQNHGSIVLLDYRTQDGRDWLAEHLDASTMRHGTAYVAEPRYVHDVVEGARNDGLIVAEA